MDPSRLSEWEPLLRSEVAVALLLLAGFVVVTSTLLVWVNALYRENQALHREFREHLKATGAFAAAFENARRILDLSPEGDHAVDP